LTTNLFAKIAVRVPASRDALFLRHLPQYHTIQLPKSGSLTRLVSMRPLRPRVKGFFFESPRTKPQPPTAHRLAKPTFQSPIAG